MIIYVSHTCTHESTHVVYWTKEQLARQRENLGRTQCPDCFQARVLRLYAFASKPDARTDRSRR